MELGTAGRQLHLQICLSQVNQDDSREDSFIPAWKNGQSMTQRLMMMMVVVVTGAAASQAD